MSVDAARSTARETEEVSLARATPYISQEARLTQDLWIRQLNCGLVKAAQAEFSDAERELVAASEMLLEQQLKRTLDMQRAIEQRSDPSASGSYQSDFSQQRVTTKELVSTVLAHTIMHRSS